MNDTVSMDEYDDICRELEATQGNLAICRKILEAYRGDKAFKAMQDALDAAWNQYSKDVMELPANDERQAAFMLVWKALNISRGVA